MYDSSHTALTPLIHKLESVGRGADDGLLCLRSREGSADILRRRCCSVNQIGAEVRSCLTSTWKSSRYITAVYFPGS